MNVKTLKLGSLAAAAALAGAMVFAGATQAQTSNPPTPQNGAMQRGRGMMMNRDGQRGTMGVGAGMGMGAAMGGSANSLMAVSARTLGMDQAALVAELNAGKTIADVAKAKGIDLARIVDAAVAARETAMKQSVANGRMTQAQLDTMLASMRANLTTQLSQKFTPCGQ